MDLDLLLAAPIGALLIFLLRLVDVSMSITRMLFAVRGYRGVAASIGFFEVLVWLLAVGTTLQHLDSVLHVIGYAAGFAMGNYVGVWLENRLAMGTSAIRAVFQTHEGTFGPAAAERLREEGYAVTEMGGRGRESDVAILNVVVPRRRVQHVLHIVENTDPAAFVTVEDIRSMRGGYVRPAGRKLPWLVSR